MKPFGKFFEVDVRAMLHHEEPVRPEKLQLGDSPEDLREFRECVRRVGKNEGVASLLSSRCCEARQAGRKRSPDDGGLPGQSCPLQVLLDQGD